MDVKEEGVGRVGVRRRVRKKTQRRQRLGRRYQGGGKQREGESREESRGHERGAERSPVLQTLEYPGKLGSTHSPEAT